MKPTSAVVTDEALLQNLLGDISLPGNGTPLSVGVLATLGNPQPPAHCMRTCLNSRADAIESHGCPFLVAAAEGRVDDGCLKDGHCPRGYQAAARQIALGDKHAVVVTVGAPTHVDTVAHLFERVTQLLEENTGFAEEMIQNYEQLNLIFDLIPQIAELSDTRAIERLLLQKVRHLLRATSLCVHDSRGGWSWLDEYGEAGAPPPGLSAQQLELVASTVRNTSHIQVATQSEYELLAGALVHLDNAVNVVIALRPSRNGAFTAGDMMLTDSVLAFGGQLIRNNELHERLHALSFQITRALVAAIDKKDHYTSGHSERVGFLTRLIAQEFGLSAAELQITEWAGLLHDIGKIGIPETILCKPGKLTKEEFDVIKKHPRMGYDILKPIASFELVLDGVLYHHENPDGSGYPKGLHGDQIPLVARIIHVADTFDALTSTRSYREAFSYERAYEIIRQDMGKRMDREAAEAFFRAFGKFQENEPEKFERLFLQHREQTDDPA